MTTSKALKQFFSDEDPLPTLSTAFVVNGFHRSLTVGYLQENVKIHYFVVEWSGDVLSWADFRHKVVGEADPEMAEEKSIRREIWLRWQEFGLKSQPSAANGVHASASPFESLSERMNWLGVDLETDSFGEQLLRANIAKKTVITWTKNPQVEQDGKKNFCFEFLQDTNTVDCLKLCQQLAGVGETSTFTNNTNTAFVFLKPHAAASEKLCSFVKELLESHNVSVVANGEIDGAVIGAKRCVVTHYHFLFNNALKVQDFDLPLSNQALTDFQARFGLTWQDALSQNLVFNAEDGRRVLSLENGIYGPWDTATKASQVLRLGRGLYVGKLHKPKPTVYCHELQCWQLKRCSLHFKHCVIRVNVAGVSAKFDTEFSNPEDFPKFVKQSHAMKGREEVGGLIASANSRKFLTHISGFLQSKRMMDATAEAVLPKKWMAQHESFTKQDQMIQKNLVRAKVQNIEELFAVATLAKEKFDEILQSIVRKCGLDPDEKIQIKDQPLMLDPQTAFCVLTLAPLKGKNRCIQKVETEYRGEYSKLVDLVRCSIVVYTEDQLERVAQLLTSDEQASMSLGYVVVRLKNRFRTPLFNGYRDALYSIGVDCGDGVFHVCEVQLHLAAIVAHKENSHTFYEYFRSYFSGSGAEELRMEVLEEIGGHSGFDGMLASVVTGADLDRLHALAALMGNSLIGDMYLEGVVRQRIMTLEKSLTSKDAYGLALNEQGRFVEAEALFREVLAEKRKKLGDSHSETLVSLNNLGLVLHNQGQFLESEVLYREVLAQRRSQLGPIHPGTLLSIDNLALLLQDMGNLEEADALFVEVLAGRRQLTDNHSDTLTTINNLSCLRAKQGRLEEATMLNREALEEARKKFGNLHPTTLRALANLGCCILGQDKFKEAEAILRECVEGCRQQLGDAHPTTMSAIDSLSMALGGLDKFEEAEQLNREVLNASVNQLGTSHPRTLQFLNNLGTTLINREKLAEGEVLLRECMTRWQQVDATHLNALNVMSNLAAALASQGKLAEAGTIALEAFLGLNQKLGTTHPKTMEAIRSLGSILQNEGKFEPAELLYRDVLTTCRRELGDVHDISLLFADLLAGVLNDQTDLSKIAEAELLKRQLLTERRQKLGSSHSTTLREMHDLGVMLRKQNKYMEAAVLFQEVLDARQHDLALIASLRKLFQIEIKFDGLVVPREEVEKQVRAALVKETRDLIERRQHGNNCPEILLLLNRLGRVLEGDGNFYVSEILYRESLHDTTTSLYDLGTLLRKQDRAVEAEALYVEAIDVERKCGGIHPDTLYELGVIQKAQGKPVDLSNLELLLVRSRRELGNVHPITLLAMHNLGKLLQAEGKLEAATALYREEVTHKRSAWGDSHSSTLKSIEKLVMLLRDQSKLGEAEDLIREVVYARKQFRLSDPPRRAAVGFLMSLLQEQGKFESLEVLQREVLAEERKYHGSSHPVTLQSINDLAMLLREHGNLVEAEELSRECVSSRKEVLGGNNFATFVSIHSLGVILQAQGKCEEAEVHFREAFAGRKLLLGKVHPDILPPLQALCALLRERLGDSHPDTLSVLEEMGVTLERQDKLDLAEASFRQVLAGCRALEDHPVMSTALQDLARVLFKQNQLKEAEALMRDAVVRERKTEINPETLETLGTILASLGRLEEACALCEEGLRKRQELGETCLLPIQNNLRRLFLAAGKGKETEALFQSELACMRTECGDKHPKTLTKIETLAWFLHSQGKLEEAEKLVQEVIAVRHGWDTFTPRRLSIVRFLAILLHEQGKFEHLEALNRESLMEQREALGDRHPLTLESIDNFAVLLKEQGKLEEAEPLSRECVSKRKEVLGEAHLDTFVSTHNLGLILQDQGRYAEAETQLQETLIGRKKLLGEFHPLTLLTSSSLEQVLLQATPHSRLHSMQPKQTSIDFISPCASFSSFPCLPSSASIITPAPTTTTTKTTSTIIETTTTIVITTTTMSTTTATTTPAPTTTTTTTTTSTTTTRTTATTAPATTTAPTNTPTTTATSIPPTPTPITALYTTTTTPLDTTTTTTAAITSTTTTNPSNNITAITSSCASPTSAPSSFASSDGRAGSVVLASTRRSFQSLRASGVYELDDLEMMPRTESKSDFYNLLVDNHVFPVEEVRETIEVSKQSITWEWFEEAMEHTPHKMFLNCVFH